MLATPGTGFVAWTPILPTCGGRDSSRISVPPPDGPGLAPTKALWAADQLAHLRAWPNDAPTGESKLRECLPSMALRRVRATIGDTPREGGRVWRPDPTNHLHYERCKPFRASRYAFWQVVVSTIGAA